MSKAEPIILNLSDWTTKGKLIAQVSALEGLHRVDIRKARSVRTNRQNAYYWSCILPVLANGMTEAWGETVSVEEVHEFAKATYLARPLVDRRTGETVGTTTRSTKTLDKAEFAEFIDKLIVFGQDMLGVRVPAPGEYEDSSTRPRPVALSRPGHELVAGT